jgi:N-acetylglucosamine kinase-like BadF-type ATPase
VVTWRTSASKGEVAALAPLVTAAAAAGDTIAREIQGTAVEDLERHVLAILEQLGPWSKAPTVALTGGLLRPGRALRDPLIRTLSRQFLTVLGRDLDPAVGAAKLGLGIGSGGPRS